MSCLDATFTLAPQSPRYAGYSPNNYALRGTDLDC